MDPFADFDFDLLYDPDFKEDAVRESLIKPLLNALGYSASYPNQRIIRSKNLTHPFVKTGSNRSHKIKSIPDYLLEVNGEYAWVLDAKAPDEFVTDTSHREQVYFYAIHPEVRVNYYALCNGREFILFEVSGAEAVLHFHLTETEQYWQHITALLTPTAFAKTTPSVTTTPPPKEFDYLAIKPLDEIKELQKQSANRHYGVHGGYFTKQVWNVVQAYIENFTKPRDVVLDPFGGSGVTVVEALLLNRKAIHVDINPLSIFLVKNLVSPVNIVKLADAYRKVRDTFATHKPETDEEINKAKALYSYPTGIQLPKNSDVSTVEELFSPKQLAQLAYLKHLIQKMAQYGFQGDKILAKNPECNRLGEQDQSRKP
jgi:hypothetical protein